MEIDKTDIEWLITIIVMLAMGRPTTINVTVVKQKPRKKPKKRKHKRKKKG